MLKEAKKKGKEVPKQEEVRNPSEERKVSEENKIEETKEEKVYLKIEDI